MASRHKAIKKILQITKKKMKRSPVQTRPFLLLSTPRMEMPDSSSVARPRRLHGGEIRQIQNPIFFPSSLLQKFPPPVSRKFQAVFFFFPDLVNLIPWNGVQAAFLCASQTGAGLLSMRSSTMSGQGGGGGSKKGMRKHGGWVGGT